MDADRRDWQGIRRLYFRPADRRRAATLRALATEDGLDPAGVRAAWGLAPHGPRTWLAAIRQVPPGMRLHCWSAGEPRFAPAPPAASRPLEDALLAAIAGWRGPEPVLALGGGLDGALVLALWRAAGRALPAVVTVRTDLPDYDESERAGRIAAAFGARPEPVLVGGDELVAALPEAVAVMEQPLYNLHPVARWRLARAAAVRGGRTLLTGDGADQLMRAVPAPDYLPLVAALTEGAGLDLWSPFFDESVQGAALARGPDPDKQALRALAARLGVPDWVAQAPKRPQYAPALDLSRHADRRALEALAAELGWPLSLASDRQAVGWITLALARRQITGRTECVA